MKGEIKSIYQGDMNLILRYDKLGTKLYSIDILNPLGDFNKVLQEEELKIDGINHQGIKVLDELLYRVNLRTGNEELIDKGLIRLRPTTPDRDEEETIKPLERFSEKNVRRLIKQRIYK